MELQNIKPELKTFLYEQIYIKHVSSFDDLYTEGYMFERQEIQHALDIFMKSGLIAPLANGQPLLQIAQKQVDFMRNDETFSRLKYQVYL
ncbi:hypothetical protein CN557_08515 [Bacillus wiedmannii]|uniref:hypothetical protein n=1 Tax=Bacillus wiedmannii TaxID=1890302 RepID=UPI000BF6C4DF|nr:hypothetical protein [Bacillus wiedmannii]PEP54085.1 hypothetical protein CN557_08515 [Bacillus wiedmannii]